jgi:uncharacterized protein involved in exopolysaccharide biosynthesis
LTTVIVEGNELRRYLSIIKRWSIFLALCTGIAGGSAYLLIARQPAMYRATTLLLVEQQGVGQGSYSDVLASNQSVATYAALIAQPVVLKQAARQVPGVSAADLSNRVQSSAEPGTSVIQLQVDDSSPTRAASLADAISTAFISIRRASAQKAFQDAQQQLAGQIDDMRSQESALNDAIARLQATNPSSPQLPTLRQQLAALTVSRSTEESVLAQLTQQYVVTTNNIRVFQPAVPPTQPDHPRPLAYGALSALLGFVLGLAVVLVWGGSLETWARGDAAVGRTPASTANPHMDP